MHEATIKNRTLKGLWGVQNVWDRIAHQIWHCTRGAFFYFRYVFLFAIAVVSPKGIWTTTGRTLIWGKLRRQFYSLVPSYARSLQKKHGMSGSCTQCGASCSLLFRCPQWDPKTYGCNVYEDRPTVCRLFPITPSDIRDRNLALKETPCGYEFKN